MSDIKSLYPHLLSIANELDKYFDIHSPLDRKLYRVKASDDFRAYIRDNNRDYSVKVLDTKNEEILPVFKEISSMI